MGPGLELGIWEFAKVATVCKERWGPGLEFGIWEFRVCKERWGPGLEFGIWEFRVCKARHVRSAGPVGSGLMVT